MTKPGVGSDRLITTSSGSFTLRDTQTSQTGRSFSRYLGPPQTAQSVVFIIMGVLSYACGRMSSPSLN